MIHKMRVPVDHSNEPKCDKSHWIEMIAKIEKRHKTELAEVIAQFQLKGIEYQSKLDTQISISTLTNTCIQDELETERENHTATKQKLSLFQGIESARALADHITEMQFFITQMKNAMEQAGTLDKRAILLIKDMHESLLLKTPLNYKFLFMSEVACRMGFTFTNAELKQIGQQIAIRVKTITGESPDKHAQFVEGHVTKVNTYTENKEYILKEELKRAWDFKTRGPTAPKRRRHTPYTEI